MKSIFHPVPLGVLILTLTGCFSGQLDTPEWVERFTDPEVVQQVEQGTYVPPTPDAETSVPDIAPVVGEASCFQLELCFQACVTQAVDEGNSPDSCAADCRPNGTLEAQEQFQALTSCFQVDAGSPSYLEDCQVERAACWFSSDGEEGRSCNDALAMLPACLDERGVSLEGLSESAPQSNPDAMLCFHELGLTVDPANQMEYLTGLGCLLYNECLNPSASLDSACEDCECADWLKPACPSFEEVCSPERCEVIDHPCGESFDCGDCDAGETCNEGICELEGQCLTGSLVLNNDVENFAEAIQGVLGCEELETISLSAQFPSDTVRLFLPNLKALNALQIEGCSGLFGVDFPSLETVDDVVIRENDDFQNLGPSPASLGEVEINDNPNLCQQVVDDWVGGIESLGPGWEPEKTSGNDGTCCGDGVVDSKESCDPTVPVPVGQTCADNCELRCTGIDVVFTGEGGDAQSIYNTLAELRHCSELGSLVLENTQATSLPTMGKLTRIAGDLRVSGAETLTSLAYFPALQQVDGKVIVQDTGITSLVLPALEQVWQEFVVSSSPIEQVDLGSLHTVEGHLSFELLDNLETLNLNALTFLTSLRIEQTAALGDVTVSNLDTVHGAISIKNNAALKTFSMVQLDVVSGSVEFVGNPSLELVDMPMLSTIHNALRMQSLESLVAVNFNALNTVHPDPECFTEDCGILLDDIAFADDAAPNAELFLGALVETNSFNMNSTKLGQLPLGPDLMFIHQDFSLTSNYTLTSLTPLPIAAVFGNVVITDNIALCDNEVASWVGMLLIVEPDAVVISGGASGPQCEVCGDVVCESDEECIAGVCVPEGECITQDAVVTSVEDLTELMDCSALNSLTISFEDESIQALPTMVNLQSVTETLSISGPGLSELTSFPNLETVGSLDLADLEQTTLIEFVALLEVNGELRISNAHNLIEVRMPSLYQVQQSLRLIGLDALGKVEVPSLQTVSATLEVGNTGLSMLFTPHANFTVQTVSIHDNSCLHPLEAKLWVDGISVNDTANSVTSSTNFSGTAECPSTCGIGCKGGKVCFRGQCLNGTDCSDINLALTNTEGAAAYQDCAVLGNLVLDNFAQPELPAFQNLKGILGDVFVRGAPGTNMGYPNSLDGIASVEWIGRHLKVESVFPDDATAALGTRVSLPHLSRIGLGEPGLEEGLMVENVEHFGPNSEATVDLPALEAVGSRVTLRSLPGDATLAMPSLRYIAGELAVEATELMSPPVLGSMDWVVEVEEVYLEDNPKLCMDDIDRWANRGNITFALPYDEQLMSENNGTHALCAVACNGTICQPHQSCDEETGQCVDGYDCGNENLIFAGESFAAAQGVSGLSIHDPDVWAQVDWEDVTRPFANCATLGIVNLSKVPQPVLTPLGKLMRVKGDLLLRQIDGGDTLQGGDILSTGVTSFDVLLPDLEYVGGLFDLYISDAETISFKDLKQVGSLVVEQHWQVQQVRFPSLHSASHVNVRSMDVLEELSLDSLTMIDGLAPTPSLPGFLPGFGIATTGLASLPVFNGTPVFSGITITFNPSLCPGTISSWLDTVSLVAGGSVQQNGNGTSVECQGETDPGLNECEAYSDCEFGGICVDGQCYDQTCDANDECPAGYECVNELCDEVLPVCSSAADCPQGFMCLDGHCVEGWDCSEVIIQVESGYGGNTDASPSDPSYATHAMVDAALEELLAPFLGCATLGGLFIAQSYASVLPEFSDLRRIDRLHLHFMYDLVELHAFPKLESIPGDLFLSEFHDPASWLLTGEFSAISFPSLKTVSNELCWGMTLDNLQHADGIYFPKLEEVCGNLQVSNLNNAPELSFPELMRVDGLLNFFSLVTPNFSWLPALQQAYGLRIKNLSQLNIWDFPETFTIAFDPTGVTQPEVTVENAPKLCDTDVLTWYYDLNVFADDAFLTLTDLKDCSGWQGGGS